MVEITPHDKGTVRITVDMIERSEDVLLVTNQRCAYLHLTTSNKGTAMLLLNFNKRPRYSMAIMDSRSCYFEVDTFKHSLSDLRPLSTIFWVIDNRPWNTMQIISCHRRILSFPQCRREIVVSTLVAGLPLVLKGDYLACTSSRRLCTSNTRSFDICHVGWMD